MTIYAKIKKNIGSFSLNAEFEAGDTALALLGSSGCGKTMTLKCIAGLEKPDEGRVVIDGTTVFDSEKKINLPPQRRETGLLFQNYALFANMTVAENILCVLKRKDKAHAEKKLRDIMESFYINGLEEHYPSQLSGGQQQRVALARMLAAEPKLIMLDEPLSALDSYLRWQIEGELAQLFKKFKGTVLYVSHNRDEVSRLCPEICVIHRGRSEKPMRAADFFKSPGSLASSRLSGCKNHSRAKKIDEHRLFAADWNCELECSQYIPENVSCAGIRAHFIKPSAGGGANMIRCGVSDIREDIFTASVTLLPEGADASNDNAYVRMELTKEEFDLVKGQTEITVSAAPQHVMPLI
ncbi:MAG: ATP-binding cassette domain-containing protein [Synergistaceae bacterium]|nr:ATP-binding cassette domain-containing protein [Synergistaceae bacterium]